MSSAYENLTRPLKSSNTKLITFFHNTHSREIAKKILREGFIFESQLSYSTDRLNPLDTVEVNYFFMIRKEYGPYTLVIQIDKKNFEDIYGHLRTSDLQYEDIISKYEPQLSDNDENLYTLPEQYIRGYYDQQKHVFVANPRFKPDWISDSARQKLQSL